MGLSRAARKAIHTRVREIQDELIAELRRQEAEVNAPRYDARWEQRVMETKPGTFTNLQTPNMQTW